jgi:hypothetical protein
MQTERRVTEQANRRAPGEGWYVAHVTQCARHFCGSCEASIAFRKARVIVLEKFQTHLIRCAESRCAECAYASAILALGKQLDQCRIESAKAD